MNVQPRAHFRLIKQTGATCVGLKGKSEILNVVQMSKAAMRNTLSLKAGHPPAVKAGGKRVVKKNNEDGGTPEKDGKRADKPRSLTTFTRMQQMGILMASPLEKVCEGAFELGHDFPETPVSVRHGKLRPSVEKLHMQRCFFIQQPRKC